jgi:hypothetical protein
MPGMASAAEQFRRYLEPNSCAEIVQTDAFVVTTWPSALSIRGGGGTWRANWWEGLRSLLGHYRI